jgi:hypothetical protein
MDRRAKKLEKKRKSRAQSKLMASTLAARRPSALALLARSAARGGFGPCFVSAAWDDLESPALVSVIVTRELPSGHLVTGTALVDRTCLGVKDAFLMEPMLARDLADVVDRMGAVHGGMLPCEPLVVQSIVFHAVEYARALGFEPHRDFPAALFGPRPTVLLSTPWSAPDRPIYLSGPRDNELAIISRLTKTVGAGGFEHAGLLDLACDDDDYQDEGDGRDDGRDEGAALVHSPLEGTVSRDGATLHIFIFRGHTEAVWHLEVEDHLGGSTVWDEQFETDHAAREAALRAIEQQGVASFLVPPGAETSLITPPSAELGT